MIRGDIEVSDHVSPRPRVDLNPRYAGTAEVRLPETSTEICARHDRTARGHRIWRIIVDMARK